MHGRDTILHIQQRIIIKKAHVKFQPDWLKIFREKVKKVKKHTNHALFMPDYACNKNPLH